MTPATEQQTPTYIAQCPACDCLVACAVAPIDEPKTMRDAANHMVRWERDGLKVSVVTVQDVRTWPSGKAFKHAAGCAQDKRKRRK